MPVLPDDIDFAVGAETTVSTKGVSVPVGQSRTVELDLYSDGDTGGPFNVSLLSIDLEAANPSVPVHAPPSLRLKLDRSAGQNGEKLYLTITRTRAAALGTIVFVDSFLGSRSAYWPIAVSQ